MSERRKGAPKITSAKDYILALNSSDEELRDTIALDQLNARQAREAGMGDVKEALRRHLLDLFYTKERRGISMDRSRVILGISTDSTDPAHLSGEQAIVRSDDKVAAKFRDFEAKRTVASLETEYDFISGLANLVYATREAIKVVAEGPVTTQLTEIKSLLETAIKVVGRYTRAFPGVERVKREAMGKIDLLTPAASIEMVEATVISSLRSTIVLATKLDEATTLKSEKPAVSKGELIVPVNADFWGDLIRTIIEKLQALLAIWNQRRAASAIVEPTENIVISNTLVCLRGIQTQLLLLLTQLEQRPGLFLYQHFELLKSVSTEPEVTLKTALERLEQNEGK